MTEDPLIGRTLAGVRIDARLGEGAMGVVYRGHHAGLSRSVALKVLHPSARGNAQERFLREGRAAARIRHANVVAVHDAGVHGSTAYLVMELVNGHSLGSILDSQGRLPAAVVATLGAGIAQGLAAIHASGVVHRDLKPDNILLGADQVVKIADLGLAKTMDDPDLLRLTGSGMVVGTPLYVAPEAIRDPQGITAKADIYSLGATLYHLLAGRPPFNHTTPYEVMRAHLEERPKPVRTAAPDTPPWLADLVDDCLAKSPDRRPDAAAVADRLARRHSRGPWRAMGLTAAGVALVAATGALVLFWPAAPQPVAPPAGPPLAVDAAGPLRWRLGDGPWQDGPIPAPPAGTRLTLELDRPGPLRRWSGPTPETGPLAPDLRPVPVAVRHPIPGDGMLYLEGRAVGMDRAVPILAAGRWRAGRWDGRLWSGRSVEVGADGQISETGKASLDRPRGPGWWTAIDDQGDPVPAHHVVCWWEAERVRAETGLPTPLGWAAQGARPAQPAVPMPAALVQAVATAATGIGGRLPDRSEATTLAARLGTPLWCIDDGRLDAVRGGPSAALVVLMPVDPADAR